MEFGKTHDININKIDFSLPPDHSMTERLWQKLHGDDKNPVHFHVGCTQWGNKDWVGKIYAKGSKEKEFLSQYVRLFNTIELNTLFYHLQPPATIERWAALAGKDFRFCPKFSSVISHSQQLRNAGRGTGEFIQCVRHFGDTLGPSFLQLSDSFGPDHAGLLQDYLRALPHDFRVCVELRHEDWFKAPAPTIAATWDLLHSLGAGTVITDTAGRRDVLHMRLSAPVAFIRFVGNNLHPTDFLRLDAWAQRLGDWIAKGLREVYFFIHSPDERYVPELSVYAIEQFNQKCGTKLKPPRLQSEEPPAGNLTLF